MRTIDLCAGYSGREILHRVSLSLPGGSLVGIVGRNGCGKTTLLRCLGGLLAPTAGQVLYHERARGDFSRREFARLAAYLPQSRSTPALTVRELTAHGRYPHLAFGRKLTQIDTAAIDRALQQMQLSELADRPLAQLSGGQRQRAYLAMVLAQDTEYLLLDEPMTYCDIAQKMELMELLRALSGQGKTIAAVLHDLPLAFSYCDCLAVMDEGRLLAFGTPDEILQTRAIDTAFGVQCRTVTIDGKTEYFFRT